LPKRTFLRPSNMPKSSEIVGVIAIINEHTSKILGQGPSGCKYTSSLWALTETLDHGQTLFLVRFHGHADRFILYASV